MVNVEMGAKVTSETGAEVTAETGAKDSTETWGGGGGGQRSLQRRCGKGQCRNGGKCLHRVMSLQRRGQRSAQTRGQRSV